MNYQIRTILEKQGYTQIALNISGLYFHLCEQDDTHYAVVTIDETAGGLFTREQLLHISEQLRDLLRKREIHKTVFLYLLITTSDTSAHALFSPDDCYWVIDCRSNRLLVFENWHPFYQSLRRALEQMMQESETAAVSPGGNSVKRSSVFRYITSCTTLLILINVLIFFLTDWSGLFLDSYRLIDWGAEYWRAIVYDHEYYRLITAMFLHNGLDHVFNNMLSLYFIGNYIEHQTGRLRFLILYFSSGILAGCTSMVYNMLQSEDASSVGASGAIFGLMGALLILVLAQNKASQQIDLRRLLLIIFVSLYGGFTSQGTDNAAHVGGFLAGIFIAALLYHADPEKFITSSSPKERQ